MLLQTMGIVSFIAVWELYALDVLGAFGSLNKHWTVFISAGSLWVCFMYLFCIRKELTPMRNDSTLSSDV